MRSVQLLTLAGAASAASIGRRQASGQSTCQWPGFSKLQYIFSFGDSYTTTGFDPTLQQPSASNPFGNPAYPGYTSSNGPNWIDFLTVQYNQSLIQTVNLAYGGATVDSALVAPYEPTVLSVKDQINTQFTPDYASKSLVPWASGNTLFTFFIGINDVGNSWYLNNATLYPTIFSEFGGLLETVYQAGARNFAFLNVPPVQRAPNSANDTDAERTQFASKIAEWNGRVSDLANALVANHSDVTTTFFDTNTLFNQVLDNPASNPLTAGYKDTTDYCVAYENGTPSETTDEPSCAYPVDEYFWLNTLHPTFPMQNVTAQALASQLSSLECTTTNSTPTRRC